MIHKLRAKYRSFPVQVRASFWFLICSFMQKGISTITTPIFTRLLSTSEYGQYGAFNSWLEIITIFVTLRLSYGVYTQGLVKFEEDQRVYSSSLQGLTLVLITCWAGIYYAFHGFFNGLFKLTTVQMTAMFVMIWSTVSFHFWATEQRVQFKYRHLVMVTIIVSLAKPLLGILLVTHAEDKVTARILGLMLAELAGYTWTFFVQMRRGRVFYSAKYWKHALLFNLPLIPHYLSQTVLNSSDRIMIQRMVDNSSAGIYTLAYNLAKIMALFNTALLNTLTPWIYKKIKAGKLKDIARVAYMALLVIAAVNILLIAFAPEAVALFAPKSYHEAIWVIPPVTLSVYFIFSYSLFACFEFYYEQTKFIMIASVSGALLNVVLNYIFIRMFGYVAAGYTTLFCYIVYAIGHYIFMRKICRERLDGEMVYDARVLAVMAGGFLALGMVLLLTYNYWYVRYAIILIGLAAMLIKRKAIVKAMKSLLQLRRERKKA